MTPYQEYIQAEATLLGQGISDLVSLGISADYTLVEPNDYVVVRVANIYKNDTRFPKPSSTDSALTRIQFTVDNYPETLFMKMSIKKDIGIATPVYDMYSYMITTEYTEYDEYYNGTFDCYHLGPAYEGDPPVSIGPSTSYVNWVTNAVDGKQTDTSISLPAVPDGQLIDANTGSPILDGDGNPLTASGLTGKTINTATDIEYQGLNIFRSLYTPLPVYYTEGYANAHYAGNLKSSLHGLFSSIKIYILNHSMFKFQNETTHGSTIVIPLNLLVGYIYNRKNRLDTMLTGWGL